MTAGERFNGWIEGRVEAWRDRLRGWMASWLMSGINEFLADNEPEAIDLVQENLAAIRDNPDTPQPLKDLIDKLLAGTKPLPVILLVILGAVMLIPTLTSIVQPLGRILNYQQDRFFKSYRLDPLSFISLQRRFPDKWSQFLADMHDLGISDERFSALLDATLFYPSAQDLVNWSAKEVFEPDARNKYGLDSEFDKLDLSLFSGAGVSEAQALNYWRAHWQHPSLNDMRELLIRGLLTASGNVPTEPSSPEEWASRDTEGVAEMYEWYRLVEIPPHWRDMITEALFNVPTRVDVRRWWDMRTIGEQELYNIYHRQGYHGKDLANYVMWTKVYTEFPSLLARWTKGWITEDEVRARLLELGMPADRVETMIQEKIRPEVQEDVSEALDLTKAETYKGVKAGKISRQEGIEVIMRLGKNEATATFLVDLNTEVLEGSPSNYDEYMDLVNKYLKATGREREIMPDEVKLAANEVVEATNALEALRVQLAEFDRGVIDTESKPEAVIEEREELAAKVANAERQVAYAKSRYETALANWRYKGD